jgi:hypothetical protein
VAVVVVAAAAAVATAAAIAAAVAVVAAAVAAVNYFDIKQINFLCFLLIIFVILSSILYPLFIRKQNNSAISSKHRRSRLFSGFNIANKHGEMHSQLPFTSKGLSFSLLIVLIIELKLGSLGILLIVIIFL